MLDESAINTLLTNPWLHLGLLLALPSALQNSARWLFLYIDHSILQSDDQNNEPTGTWLKQQATLYPDLDGLTVFPLTTVLNAVDGFWPSLNAIVLAHTTYTGHGSRDRHIGAHELGHAVLHNRIPLLGRALSVARMYLDPSGLLILAFVAVTLFGSTPLPWVYTLAFFTVLSVHFLVLFDEAFASIFAYRHFKMHSDLKPVSMHLLAAWTVYFLPFFGTVCQYVWLHGMLLEPQIASFPAERRIEFQAIPFLCVLTLMLIKRCRTVFKILIPSRTPETLGDYELFFKRTLTGDISGGAGIFLFCVFSLFATQITAPPLAYWLAMIPGCIPAQRMGRGLIQWLMMIAERPFLSNQQEQSPPHSIRENPANSLWLLAANAAHLKKTYWVHILFLPLLCIWWFKYLYTLAV